MTVQQGKQLIKNALYRTIGETSSALGFVAIAILRLPLLPTMLVLTPLSIYLAARSAR